MTAGASGIGRAIAERFHNDGHLVHICDVSQENIDSALSACPGMKGELADVGDAQAVEAFFNHVMEESGGIDVLINNAGIAGPRAPLEQIDYSDWDNTIRVNLNGMFYCIKQVIPHMKKQQDGSIINISTGSTRTGLPYRLPYVAGKEGVNGLTRNVARELGPYNIRCNAILPGMVDNARGRAVLNKLAEQRNESLEQTTENLLRYVSMRTLIAPEEIAEMAYFLASDASHHVTGQLIGVCGNLEWEE